MALKCGDCGSPMALRTSRFGKFYGCSRFPACGGAVGAHADGRPIGTPADARTRAARKQAHDSFDQLWKPDRRGRRHMTRTHAYRWMQTTLGIPEALAHVALMDAETCGRLIVEVERWLAVAPPRE